ncbi:MAG: lytic transglycosylase domain-containing protein [Motiliproteus sp.]|nr:lytic transglycosylase domain-containing protein [Motiliproteus sp.]MCW9053002.1 lytic transglycosylase domain-containing protein [Motiliproteus sp.]
MNIYSNKVHRSGLNYIAGGLCTLLILIVMSDSAHAKLQSTKALQQEWQQTLIQRSQPRNGVRFPYEHCFDKAASRHGISKSLLLAVARGESDFNPTAVSHANAIGMMQILWPGTARHLGIWRKSALYDPCTNIDAGTRYLKELIKLYDGDINLVLSAYNYGPGRIKVNAKQVPSGAAWYSRYILRHYHYVTKASPAFTATNSTVSTKLASSNTTTRPQKTPKKAPPKTPKLDYNKVGKLELIKFDRPYRAQAYIKLLKTRAPELQLDWFRMPDYSYRVVARYQNRKEFSRLTQRLSSLGINVGT